MAENSGVINLTVDGGSASSTDAKVSGFISPIENDYTTMFMLGGM